MTTERVDLLHSTSKIPAGASFVRFGEEILVLAPEGDAAAGRARMDGEGARLLQAGVPLDRLHVVVQVGNRFEAEHPEVPVLFRKGRYLVIDLPPYEEPRVRPRGACFSVRPLQPNEVLFEVRARSAARASRSPAINSLLVTLSRARMRSRLELLASFPTRLSSSPQFKEAAEWARDQFVAHGCEAGLFEIPVGSKRSSNVVADRPSPNGGTTPLVIVTAHLDSINSDGTAAAPAPGADDNASGAAGVLELAAVLEEADLAADVRFILFGGEEQGLFGSARYVASLSAEDRGRIAGVVNMDMIGCINGTPDPTVLIEGGEVSRALIDSLARAAETYTGLTVQTSLDPHNSDHVPFIERGIPAVLLIEGTDEANTNVHTARDTIDRVNYDLMSEILAMHAAYIGEVSGL